MAGRNQLIQLREMGQSPWCDQLSRQMLLSGQLANLIDQGIVGLTSNPTIFQKAIAGGDWYDDQIRLATRQGLNLKAIYEQLAVADVQAAADLLLPIYEGTGGQDGYVSLEVSPDLAYNPEASVAEATRLWQAVDRPNLMIKVPATRAALSAVVELLSRGINVNVTLIFGLQRYREVLAAHAEGLARAAQRGAELDRIASVASFFVSRVDTLVDRRLEEKGNPGLLDLRGKAAIANAKAARREWEKWCAEPTIRQLVASGARPQRLLWASTSTKNPAYSDVLYVEELIGPRTVNTMPPETIAAFLDHGQVRGATLTQETEEATHVLHRLAEAGIDMEGAASELEAAGVDLFAASFQALLRGLQEKVGPMPTTTRT